MKNIIKISIIVIICFLFLEQSSRFFLFGLDSLNYFKMRSIRQQGVSGLIKPSPYMRIIFELKPNLNTYFKIARFITNSCGLRDKEYLVDKQKNTFRVVVLGDSFTMGSGVDIEETFHFILESRLNKESSGVVYEFINFGVGGYDPNQCLATLRYKALKYSPDLALFCLCGPLGNDFYPEEAYNRIYTVKPTQNTFFKSYFLELVTRNRIVLFIKNNLLGVKCNWRKKTEEESENYKIKKLEEVFQELSQISKEQNIPICIVVLQNTYLDIDKCIMVKDLVAKYRLYFFDTTPFFKNTKLSDYIIYKIDCHPNAKANKIFAEGLYHYLKEQHLLEKHY